MFKRIRARYAILAFGRRKFPQIDRSNIKTDHIIENFTHTENIVTKNTKVTSIGSCFAEEILKWMENNGYSTLNPKWGMVYNPKNIRLIVQAGLEFDSFNPKERFWDFGDGDIRTPYVKSDQSEPIKLGNSIEQAKSKEKILFGEFGKTLKSSEVLIITLGQTEYWASEKEYPFYAAPWAGIKDGDKNHKFFNLSHQETKDELEKTIQILKKHNPRLKILISISPVPLVASVLDGYSAYISAGRAKSTLHSAALEVIENYENVFYMPSYEIVTSNPQKSFKPDGRHVLGETVSKIMGVFKNLYTY